LKGSFKSLLLITSKRKRSSKRCSLSRSLRFTWRRSKLTMILSTRRRRKSTISVSLSGLLKKNLSSSLLASKLSRKPKILPRRPKRPSKRL
jgi:hypothetical protein